MIIKIRRIVRIQLIGVVLLVISQRVALFALRYPDATVYRVLSRTLSPIFLIPDAGQIEAELRCGARTLELMATMRFSTSNQRING
jgi:hypothetical protein